MMCLQAIGAQTAEGMPELSEVDLVIFLGDFNYRLDGVSYDEARDFISQRCFDWLRERDQLQAEMKAGNVFQGMREAVITFPPTYKFEKHQAGLAGWFYYNMYAFLDLTILTRGPGPKKERKKKRLHWFIGSDLHAD
jgi:hypothetical protein